MDPSNITYNPEGFDTDAIGIISSRHSKLQVFARLLLVQQEVDSLGIGDDVLRTTLRTVVDTVQDQRYSVVSVDSLMIEATFLPLAQALGIPEQIRLQQIRQWWKAGLFHTSFGKPTRDKERSGIILNLLDEQVTTILNSSPDKTTWYRQFCEKNVCRDDSAATRISRTLDNVNPRAASVALDIARAWCTHGNLGLLTNSTYPYTHELLRIEQHRTTLQIKTAHINTLIATLRADIVAVLRMLDDHRETTRTTKKLANQVCIADHSVLHQPAYALVRQKFRERLVPVREYCIAALVQCRACEPSEAVILLDTVFANGLAGLIDWRASTLSEGRHPDTFDWQRIKHIAGPLINWMPSEAQQTILKRLRVCIDADAAVGTGLAFTRLVKDMPSTLYRRRLQRRRFTAQFYITFADSCDVSLSSSRNLIKNFIVYGLLGLLEQGEWKRVVHPQLWHYLWMFKLGRAEDTVTTTVLVERVNTYAQELGQPKISSQAINALYSHFPKPAYYNSGDGLATAGVPLRRSLKLAGVDRLHEQWLLLPVKLSIVPVDTASQPIGECCYAILAVDSGSSCVVDFWLTSSAPDASTYCLAFYNALFHPAAPKWPLRGIPENIVLPALFADDPALCKAAAYLMVGVRGIENVEDELKSRKAIRTLLREIQSLHKPPLISTRRRGPMQHYTIVEAERTIRTWLYNRSFADHQVKLAPPTLRKYGVVLPGYNTPAAGWLLPVIGSTRTIRDGIELEKLVYSNPEAGIEPGIDVQVRSLPAQFGRAQGVFIEYTSGLLTYLRLVPR